MGGEAITEGTQLSIKSSQRCALINIVNYRSSSKYLPTWQPDKGLPSSNRNWFIEKNKQLLTTIDEKVGWLMALVIFNYLQ